MPLSRLALIAVLLASSCGPATPQVLGAPRVALRPTVQFSISPTAYVPVGLSLRPKKIPRAVVAEQIRLSGNRTPVLNEIIRQAPKYFPPGAKVLSVKWAGPLLKRHFEVSLGPAFNRRAFWSGLGRRRTILAMHALAREVAFQVDGKGTAMPVRFLIEGKRVDSIGSFNASQLLRPDEITRAS